jgi:pimeloyl-ACP methyl ester carboxylesterase
MPELEPLPAPGLYRPLRRGLRELHAGRAREAHEAFEDAWRASRGRTAELLRALAQLAAARVKHDVPHPIGAAKLLAKVEARLEPLAAELLGWLGLDLVALLARVRAARAELDAHGTLNALTLPANTSRDAVLYLHGFASGPSSAKARALVPALRAEGMRVEVPALDEGNFSGFTVSRALRVVRRNLADRTLIVGSSLGGYLGSLVAADERRVVALVLMAPAFDFATRLGERHTAADLAAWKTSGSMEVPHHVHPSGKGTIGHALFEDALTHPGRPELGVPTYVLQGRRDETVPAAMVAQVVSTAPGPVELDLVDDDHGLVASAPRALEAARRFIRELGLRSDDGES